MFFCFVLEQGVGVYCMSTYCCLGTCLGRDEGQVCGERLPGGENFLHNLVIFSARFSFFIQNEFCKIAGRTVPVVSNGLILTFEWTIP